MEYTINKLAQLAGVSTRTLRYYDGDIIGLYQGSPKNKGFHRYSPIFLTLKREFIVRWEVV